MAELQGADRSILQDNPQVAAVLAWLQTEDAQNLLRQVAGQRAGPPEAERYKSRAAQKWIDTPQAARFLGPQPGPGGQQWADPAPPRQENIPNEAERYQTRAAANWLQTPDAARYLGPQPGPGAMEQTGMQPSRVEEWLATPEAARFLGPPTGPMGGPPPGGGGPGGQPPMPATRRQITPGAHPQQDPNFQRQQAIQQMMMELGGRNNPDYFRG